ncbi:MAG: Calx-beta domain-containing protein [Isosphaeraceae bacterium]
MKAGTVRTGEPSEGARLVRRRSRVALPSVEAMERRELLTTAGVVPPALVSLAVSGGSISERGGQTVITASLASATGQPVTVGLSYSGTAKAGVNYSGAAPSITIPAGQTTGSVTITGVSDQLKTDNLTLVVTLGTISNGVAAPGAGSVQVTLVDGDFTPTVIVGDVTVDKHASGTRDAAFTILLSNPSGQTVTVQYATADGSGTAADHDYLPISGKITFAPGETQKTVTVQVVGDTILEPDETFSLVLSNPVNTVIARASGTCTILNRFDFENGLWSFGSFQFSASTATVQGSAGTANIVVTRTGGSTGAVSVRLTTGGGNAVPGVNYVATTATINFADGETKKTVSIPVLDGGTPGGVTAVGVVLANPTGGATLGTRTAMSLAIVASARNTTPAPVSVKAVVPVTDARQNVKAIVVALSGDISAAQARSLASYRLASAGKSGSYDASDAKVIKLASVTYDAAKRLIVLVPVSPFSLAVPVQLRMLGLVDVAGRGLTNPVAVLSLGGVTFSSVKAAPKAAAFRYR